MAVFKPKEYKIPKTVQEATGILRDHSEKALVLAGGTTFYEIAKRGLISDVEIIVDIEKVGLNYVRKEDDTVRIGAMCTLTELANRFELVTQSAYAGLYDALIHFTPLQIRNLATVGGEVSTGLSSFDLPPILLALGSNIMIATDGKARVRPLDGFFLDFFTNDLKKGEIVTEIQIPRLPPRSGTAFQSIKRNAVDLALVNTGVRVTLGDKDECTSILIALGGIDRTPIRAREVEKMLKGKKLSQQTISEAVEPISEFKPISSFHASPKYKREVCKVLVRDALLAAARRAKEGFNA